MLLAGVVSAGSVLAAESTERDGAIDVISTLTPLEKQQIDQQRPTYHQPTVVEGVAPPTTLPLEALVADAVAQGDAVRGAAVFFNEQVACATCHTADFGYQLGPQLTDARPDATRPHLVEAILHPSKTIHDGYQSVTVVTADGEVLSGYLVSRNDADIVLSLPTDKGRTRVLPAEDVDEVILQEQSTMPAGLVGQLKDRQAFLDLARFVFSINEGGKAELRRLKAEARSGE